MILLTFGGVWANAQIPAGFVSYEARPDILSVTPKDHPSFPKFWEALKRGHLEAVAQVLELYPEHEIYFLARDSELLYDFANLATQDEPTYAKRIHLLNVSRANMRAEHIKDYLAQEGISESALKSGKKILFVDTGFSGTIPRVIEEYFPEGLRHSFQTHLLSSSNSSHPSTRVFLQSLNPAAAEVHPSILHGSIIEYEEMHHFTDRSNGFAQVKGKWVPISKAHSASDGKVDQTVARRYQESLAAYQKSDEGKKLFKERRKIYRKLRQLQDHPDQLKKELQALLNQKPQDPYQRALVIDFLETEDLHHGRQKILPQDLGITLPEASPKLGNLSNKNQLIQKYPEWAWVLEDPETEISKLLKAQDYTTLGAINDVIQDQEYLLVFTRTMGKQQAPTAKDAALVDALIQSGKVDTMIATHILSKPYWAKSPELVDALIKNKKADMHIAMHVLSKSHWANHPEYVEALIQAGKADWEMAMYALSEPHWRNHPTFKAKCPAGVTLECLKEKLIDRNRSARPCGIHQVLEPMFSSGF